MARPKKVKYEYVEALGLYRKRIKSPTGQYCALYGRTPEELTEKIEEYETLRPLSAVGRENRLVNDYVQDWLDLHGETISFGTRVSYQSAIDQNIKPGMEGKRMLDVKPDDIKAVMRGVDGKSESIYRTTYMLLNQIFSSAYENHDILSNPCSTKIPSGGVPAKVRTALTDNQVEILLDTIKGTKSFVFCMIALYSGLRREEILGLQWDCVHLEKTPRIEVKRALRFEHNQPVVSEKLKTKVFHFDNGEVGIIFHGINGCFDLCNTVFQFDNNAVQLIKLVFLLLIFACSVYIARMGNKHCKAF